MSPWTIIILLLAVAVTAGLLDERWSWSAGRLDVAPVMQNGEPAAASHMLPAQMDVDYKMSAIADNMIAWHNAALIYATANPGYVGIIPTASLSLPSWYSAIEPWTSVMGAGGVVATYFTGDGHDVSAPRLAVALLQLMSGYEGVGIVSGGKVSSGYVGQLVTAPASVPNGAVAIVMQIG